MLNVGLTGNVASGKSSVAKVWADAGVPVLDADRLAREVVEPGTPGLEEVRQAFGDGVLGPGGELDRARLRELVFHDAAARRRLEAVLHPRIAERRAGWLEARRTEGASIAVSEIPLLFEAGLANEFDLIVFVDAPESERLRRLVEDRDLGIEPAREIMRAQEPPEGKRSRADYVITNDGTREELVAAARALLGELRIRAAEVGGGRSS